MADAASSDAKPRLTGGQRWVLGIIAVLAAIVALVLYFDPPTETKTTKDGEKTTQEVSPNRPDSIILAAGGVALVLGLMTWSAGAVGLTFAGASVNVNELIKERDQAARERDAARRRERASDKLVGTLADAPQPGEFFAAPSASSGEVVEQLAEVASSVPEPSDERSFEERVLAELRTLPGAEVVDLRGRRDAGADFLVRRADVSIALEAKQFARRSSLDLSATFARLAAARDDLGASLGILVVPDETMLTGAVGAPGVGLTLLPRMNSDITAWLDAATDGGS